MSVRTNRWLIVSVLAVGALAAQGCGSDKKKKDTETDAGSDAGKPGDGDGDGQNMDAGGGGNDAGGGEPLACAPCEDTMALLKLPACCDDMAQGDKKGACGANLGPIAAVAGADSPLNGCFAKDQPGDESAHCADFFDMIDGNANGTFDLMAGPISLTFPGCCTPQGECGVVLNEFNYNGQPGDLGLGCVPFSRFKAPAADADAGAPAMAPTLAQATPYCVPAKKTDDAACPPVLLPQICEGLTAAGLGCTAGDATPDWLCAQAGLPKIDGTVPTVDSGCMAGVPEIVAGCGLNKPYNPQTDKAFCVSNVKETVFGCEQVTSDVAKVPSVVCGCGGDGKVPGAAGPCLPNVEFDVCGADTTSAASTPINSKVDGVQCIPGFPEILSGCAGPATSYPVTCIPNEPANVIGCVDITDQNKPVYMAAVPNIACGCGDTVKNTADPGTAGFCLTGIPDTICGLKAACTEGGTCTPMGGAADSGTCLDIKGTGGTTPGPNPFGQGTIDGDDIGDYCYVPPPT